MDQQKQPRRVLSVRVSEAAYTALAAAAKKEGKTVSTMAREVFRKGMVAHLATSE